ncbi:MAG TPA: O-fucosyltransferase family protein [Clostridiales bacterium]|nr:O-fucosyltransferase family protein [Clostridiales bacterium]
MAGDRFLLIKPWCNRLWSDLEHTLGQLLIAEITNRIPVIYWPTHCLHNGFIHTNGFELYFEPVSNYSIFDLAKPDYTFYPPVWDADNLLVEDSEKDKWSYRSIGDFISSDANVVVGDAYFSILEIIPFIGKDNSAYGMSGTEIYRYLFKKYIRIKRDILAEVQGFCQSWLRDAHPLLAVHIRREEDNMVIDVRKDIADERFWNRYSRKYYVKKNPKKKKRKLFSMERGKLQKANTQYHAEIRKFMDKYAVRNIFLMTDSKEVLEEYRKMYGDKLIYTDCKRLTDDEPAYNIENPMIKRRRGIETIKDAYLAAECDFFIGNDFSSLSRAVYRMKDWPEENVKLLFRQRKRRKYPVNVKIITPEENKTLRLVLEFIKKLYRKIREKLYIGGGENGN